MVLETFDILGTAKLTAFLPLNVHLDPTDPRRIRPAILILPGGGYTMISNRESEPIALQFLSQGITAFVLSYSVNSKFPRALSEAAESMKFIRKKAGEWELDPERIAVCGFSAGGHLAASLAVFWNHGFLNDLLGSQPSEIRPDGAILGYPVLSAAHPHSESFRALLQDEDTPERRKFLSIEEHIDDSTPPFFIWHTFDDSVVPLEGVLEVMKELKTHGVPFEAHVWAHGPHGLALGTPETRIADIANEYPCAGWPARAADWIRTLPNPR